MKPALTVGVLPRSTFAAVETFTLDHVSSQNNVWGAMFYGSAGPSTVVASNFQGTRVDIDVQKQNGEIRVDGSHYSKAPVIKDSMPKIAPATQASIADAKPRPVFGNPASCERSQKVPSR